MKLGNWEVDTVLGKPGTGGLVTVVDRTSRLLLASKIEDKTASAVQAALIRLLEGMECRSLTTDNGKEFARHKEVSAALGAPVYFAHPHSPWERGTNEISRRPANKVSCVGRLVSLSIRTDSFANLCPRGSIFERCGTMMFCEL